MADADRLMRRRAVGQVLVAAPEDLAAAQAEQTADGAEQRGFPGSVGADEGDDLALLDVDGQVVQHSDRAVGDVEVLPPKASWDRLAEIGFDDFGMGLNFAGVPTAMVSPWSRTVIRCEIHMTRFMSCSMSQTPSWKRSRIMRMRSMRWIFSSGFMPAAGSSRSRTRGCVARRGRFRGGADRRS